MMGKIHLDTDLGGDIDDLCGLAMLLHWADVELTGITTVAEANGRRAGYVYPIRPGFPQWGNEMDWNIQVDVKSAKHVMEHSNPTLIPLSVTVETALRRAYLNDLRKSGAFGQLLAQQAEAFAVDEQNEKKYGETCEGLPNDIINFLHDPLACAIAVGWNDEVEIEEFSLILEEKDGWLYERIDPLGKPTRLVTKINGTRFSNFWLNKIING